MSLVGRTNNRVTRSYINIERQLEAYPTKKPHMALPLYASGLDIGLEKSKEDVFQESKFLPQYKNIYLDEATKMKRKSYGRVTISHSLSTRDLQLIAYIISLGINTATFKTIETSSSEESFESFIEGVFNLLEGLNLDNINIGFLLIDDKDKIDFVKRAIVIRNSHIVISGIKDYEFVKKIRNLMGVKEVYSLYSETPKVTEIPEWVTQINPVSFAIATESIKGYLLEIKDRVYRESYSYERESIEAFYELLDSGIILRKTLSVIIRLDIVSSKGDISYFHDIGYTPAMEKHFSWIFSSEKARRVYRSAIILFDLPIPGEYNVAYNILPDVMNTYIDFMVLGPVYNDREGVVVSEFIPLNLVDLVATIPPLRDIWERAS